MSYIRQDVNGSSPQDIKKLNDNIMNLWQKTFGDISYSDVDNGIRQKLNTNYLPISGEANLDSNHPYIIRVYVPEDVKTIKKSSINIILSKYRTDSRNTSSSDSSSSTSSYTSSAGGATTSSAGGATTSSSGSSTLSSINNSWGANETGAAKDTTIEGVSTHTHFYSLNHYHTVTGHVHTIGSHVHTIDNHTHDVSITVQIPSHNHTLQLGIFEADTVPSGVCITVNGNKVLDNLSGDNSFKNEIDITNSLTIGSWNLIQITSSSVARITLYGLIQVVKKY